MYFHVFCSLIYSLKTIIADKVYKITKIENRKAPANKRLLKKINLETFPELIPENKLIIEKFSYLPEFKSTLGRIKLIYPQLYELMGLKEIEEIHKWKGICNCIPLLIKCNSKECKCLGPRVFTMPYNVKKKSLFYSQSNITSEVKCTPSYNVFNPYKNSIECINGCAKALNIVGPSNCERTFYKHDDESKIEFNKFYENKIPKNTITLKRQNDYPKGEYLSKNENNIFSSFMQFINSLQGEIKISKRLLKKIEYILIDIQTELETNPMIY